MLNNNFNHGHREENYQTSVSDADRDIQILEATDNAENSVKPRFRHHPFTLGLGFLGLHRRLMLDSIYLAQNY